MEKISVLIADDHSLMRVGLTQILEMEDDIKVIGQASDGRQAVEYVEELKPDIILIDINMPVLNGLAAVKEIKKKKCDTRIIILTIHEDREYLVEAIKIGASGYIMKDAEAEYLIQAIRDVYKGGTYIQPNISSKLIYNNENTSCNEFCSRLKKSNLTKREVEVLHI